MSGEPTMYSCFKLLLTVLRPLTPSMIAAIPNAIRTAAATKPPIWNTLRISRLLLHVDDLVRRPCFSAPSLAPNDRRGIRLSAEVECGYPSRLIGEFAYSSRRPSALVATRP